MDCEASRFLVAANQCRDQCNGDQYPDAQQVCQGCHAHCDGCIEAAQTDCKLCALGICEVLDPDPSTKWCEATCPERYFPLDAVTCSRRW